jgi:hypothetical protein
MLYGIVHSNIGLCELLCTSERLENSLYSTVYFLLNSMQNFPEENHQWGKDYFQHFSLSFMYLCRLFPLPLSDSITLNQTNKYSNLHSNRSLCFMPSLFFLLIQTWSSK